MFLLTMNMKYLVISNMMRLVTSSIIHNLDYTNKLFQARCRDKKSNLTLIISNISERTRRLLFKKNNEIQEQECVVTARDFGILNTLWMNDNTMSLILGHYLPHNILHKLYFYPNIFNHGSWKL